jgi:hypothetical protein
MVQCKARRLVSGYHELDGLLPFASPRQREFIEAIQLCGSKRGAAKSLGIAHQTIDISLKRLRGRAAVRGHAPDHDMTRTVPEPFVVRGVSTYYNKDGVAAGQWVKSRLDDQQYIEHLQAIARGISNEVRPVEPLAKPTTVYADLLAVYPLGDPHAGLYASIRETGQHFDLAEFERINRLAIDAIINATPPAKTALYIDLGDTTHASDDKKRTPGSGHYLDTSGRMIEAIESAFQIKCYHLDRLLHHHEHVIFRLNRGNHDPVTAVAISGMVRERYRNEPRLTVVDAGNPYWYFEFGACMVATAHGDGAKAPEMGPIMATDQAPMWGRTQHRFAYLGHVHHRHVKEFPGVTVEYFGTIAVPDWYSHHHGYRAKRQIRSVVLHRDHGEWGGAVRHVGAFG